MKKLLLCLLIFTSTFLVTGCWDRIEINDIALIMGVAIDKKDDNLIEVTVELISPGMEAGATGGEGGGVGKTLTRGAVGVNIAEALEKLQERLPRKVFWGHSEIIVIGETLAKDGFLDDIQFFLRHREPRIRAYVFVAKGNAKEVMALTPPIEPTSSEVLREMAVFDTFVNVTLLELLQMIDGESKAAAVPMIQLLPPTDQKTALETIAYISGTAVIKEGKMSGTLDDSLTRGVKWLRNEIKHGNVSVKPKGEEDYLTAVILEGQSELHPQKENGQWKIIVQSDVTVEVTKNATSLDLSLPKNIEVIEKEIANLKEHRMKLAVEKAQKEMNADIFGFDRAIEVTYPKEWEKMKEDWDEIFPAIEVTYDTRVKVIRLGQVQGLNEVYKK